MSNQDQVDHRDTQEYKEGVTEYKQSGTPKTKCPDSPYKDGQKISWLIGWLDARTEDALSRSESKRFLNMVR